MTVQVKICGIRSVRAIEALVAGGAVYAGFVFYPQSPRAVTLDEAAALARHAGGRLKRVGLVVDGEDDFVADLCRKVPLDYLQLHGRETPRRVDELRRLGGLPVIKAVAIAGPQDVVLAKSYQSVVDMLLFDAKPPKSMPAALPGGNGLAFDWRLIAGEDWRVPWMLSGGLDADNVAEAIVVSGARMVDVSSGVESRPGEKDMGRISAFLQAAGEAK
jgi:phosphoribosylanthranilate isomerase